MSVLLIFDFLGGKFRLTSSIAGGGGGGYKMEWPFSSCSLLTDTPFDLTRVNCKLVF